jgi:hypothetical protein
VPHAFEPVVSAKSLGFVPPIVMEMIVSEALPVLLSVAARAAEVVATVVPGKAKVGVSVAVGAETAAKLAVTLCGAFMVTVVEALLELATLPVQLLKM